MELPKHLSHPLDAIFKPRTVAVIGATESAKSVGRPVLWNLLSNPFGGTVYPVNPKRPSVLGIRAYPSVKDLPERPDLAVVVTPAQAVPAIIKECVDAKIPGAIVISAGFKELGAPGIALEKEILTTARAGGLRLIGPNCLGVMNPLSGLNATFAAGIAKPGNVAFISQSGALCTAVLDWSLRELVGFSSFVSIGSMLDINWGDLIDYFGSDPRTKSILIYMESIGDARSFLSAAREVALSKPIIVIKAGRTEQAAKAAASHTGSLAGSDDVLEAAFRRVGVLRVNEISDLFSMAEVLSRQPRPQGKRLTMVTNAGGPGVLATDALITGGGELSHLAPETMETYNAFLPPHWSRNNPIDVLGDADITRYAKAVEIAANDPNTDGLLVILTPQDMTDATATAEGLKQYAKLDKPVLASWMGGPFVEAGRNILNSAGIPTFNYPDAAARAFNYMWKYTYNLQGIYETPSYQSDSEQDEFHWQQAKKNVDTLISNAHAQNRTLLDEFESKKVMQAYGIPVVPTEIAETSQQAAELAQKFGFPVVLKLFSKTITHKTDVGGVRLDLRTREAVVDAFNAIKTSVAEKAGAQHFNGVTVQPMIKLSDAYEIILGSSIDAQFGPVLLFGAGGQLVEVFKDRSLALPPLNATLARRMMEQTKIYTALKGVRGRKPVDVALLENILSRFARLVVENPLIKEIDINPLLASSDAILALDARVVLHPAGVDQATLPKVAIRPYPSQYVTQFEAKGGAQMVLRPIRPEDEPLMVKFHATLSESTVRARYFHPIKLGERISHQRLARICFNDYDREMAIVVDYLNPNTKEREILGVGRLTKALGVNEAEFAIVISDAWQGKGIGTKLLQMIVQIGKDEKVDAITAEMLGENRDMQNVAEKLGFKMERSLEEDTVHAELQLR
jgi:acetyltransferase